MDTVREWTERPGRYTVKHMLSILQSQIKSGWISWSPPRQHCSYFLQPHTLLYRRLAEDQDCGGLPDVGQNVNIYDTIWDLLVSCIVYRTLWGWHDFLHFKGALTLNPLSPPHFPWSPPEIQYLSPSNPDLQHYRRLGKTSLAIMKDPIKMPTPRAKEVHAL